MWVMIRVLWSLLFWLQEELLNDVVFVVLVVVVVCPF